MRILVVEDQPKLASNIAAFLEAEAYDVDVRHDGAEGLDRALAGGIDLLVLDVNLPTMDGYTVCRTLRERGSRLPVLMLTARDSRQDVVQGLDLGADDYLTKPFDLTELLARIRALLRRATPARPALVELGPVTIDAAAREVRKDGERVELSPKEFALLEFLAARRGDVQDRPTILEQVWGDRDDLMFSQTVDVHIAYLRRKLGKDVIATVSGKGYVIPAA
ncbi:MAG: response regulator transcription factor [Candidatus Peribacteraceae bacterium]|nr:response regulator transcription factor [Candidatus Peribacteraceae bacterium]